eukprot:356232-Chlamydomonas_euryale.AAC.10
MFCGNAPRSGTFGCTEPPPAPQPARTTGEEFVMPSKAAALKAHPFSSSSVLPQLPRPPPPRLAPS